MNAKTQKIVRFAIAACLSLIIFAVSLNAGIGRVEYHLRFSQRRTVKNLKTASNYINIYRKRQGKLPASLKDVVALLGENNFINDNGELFDGWRNPIIYQRRGASYLLISYGRDGKPGGVGLDCDFSSDNLNPQNAAMPFSQVTSNPAASSLIRASLISAAATFLLAFSLIKPKKLSFEDVGCLVLQIAATLLATFIFASILVLAAVSWGH